VSKVIIKQIIFWGHRNTHFYQITSVSDQ